MCIRIGHHFLFYSSPHQSPPENKRMLTPNPVGFRLAFARANTWQQKLEILRMGFKQGEVGSYDSGTSFWENSWN